MAPTATLPAADLRLRPARRPQQLAREAPRLSVVIVNYRQWENTARLVAQLLSSGEARREVEVIVVDNHSPDHPLASRLRRWPGVSVRRWDENRGFARAANEGVRLSRADWLLLLNPDMTITGGFLE